MDDILKNKKPKKSIWSFIQYCALFVVSLCAVAINTDETMIFMVMLLAIIVIPCLFISVISFFYNIRFNTKKKHIYLIWNIINFCLLACFFIPHMGCEACKMTENFERNMDSFAQCQSLLNKKLKSDYRLYYKTGWNTEIGSYNGNCWLENKVNPALSNNTILANIGLNKDDLKEINSMLKATNCIGIDVLSSDVIELTYKQQGFGMYSYLLFNHNLTDSELDSLANMCSYIPISETVVLKYNPGATGNLCFPRCDKHQHKISEYGL